MCGRINIHDSERIRDFMADLGLPVYPVLPPQYNITPGSVVPVLRGDAVLPMEWGIRFGKFRHPNSRCATVLSKPWLRPLLRSQRCIIPANRFYEWPDLKARPAFRGGKTRFCIHTPEDVMFFGGIWRVDPQGAPQFNILTTDPSPQIDVFHHRMPLIIAPQQVAVWTGEADETAVTALMRPYEGELIIYEADPWVDDGRHQGARCMAKAGDS